MSTELDALRKQNADLMLALQQVKNWEISGWLERGFTLPTELRATIQSLLDGREVDVIADDELPPLPPRMFVAEQFSDKPDAYIAGQMLDYARAAIRHSRSTKGAA